MSKSVKHLVMLAMFTTMALTIFVVEAQIPIPVPIYGVKLGLANVITLIVLVVYRPRDAFAVLVMRILLGSLFTGTLVSMIYSLSGGILCFLGMALLCRLLHRKHLWFISMIGAVLHNVGQIAAAIVFQGFLQGAVAPSGEVEGLHHAHALHIFQHLGHKPLVGIELPLGKGLLRPLHGSVDGEEQQQSRQRNKPHTPVKEEHHRCDDTGGQKPARCHHDHAGGDIRHVFHGVGGDGRDLAEAVVIEPAHRQVAQVLGNFDAFVGAGAVAAYGLQHGGLHVDGDGHNQRSDDDSKARPECRHGDILFQQRLNDDGGCRNTHGRANGADHTQPDRGDEHSAVVLTAEIKELFQCLEHYAISPSSLTLMWASHMF